MSLQEFESKKDIQNGIVAQDLGPSILAPAEALQNLVKKSNELISEHRHWLAGFPQRDTQPTSTSTTSPTHPNSRTTTPPTLELRAAAPEPQLLSNLLGQDCTSSVSAAVASQGSVLSASIFAISASAASQLTSASSQLTSALSQASQFAGASSQLASLSSQAAAASAGSISVVSALASANSQLASANSALARITSSIAGPSSGNAAAAQSASLAIAAATSSANSLVSAAQASASSANALAFSAQSSASSLVLIINASASSVSSAAGAALESASEILRSASQIVSDANGTATLAQAMATITPAAAQTSMTVWQTRQNTISPSRLALAIVFSIVGSSLVSILAFYFLHRYWKTKKSFKNMNPRSWNQPPGKEKSGLNDEDPFESAPRPSMRHEGSGVGFKAYRYAIDHPLPAPSILVPPLTPLPLTATRKSPIFIPVQDPSPSPEAEAEAEREREQDPKPRFLSWLSHSVRTVSTLGPFVDFRTSKEIRAARRKEEMQEKSEIRQMAMRAVRAGEERRGEERRKRESDERRVRARVENEEVERLVGLRKEREREMEIARIGAGVEGRERISSSRNEGVTVGEERNFIGTAR